MPIVTELVSSRNEKSLCARMLCPASSAPKLMVAAQEVETFNFQTLQHPLPTRSLGDQRLPCIQELGKKVPQAPSSPQNQKGQRSRAELATQDQGHRETNLWQLTSPKRKATTGLISLGPSSLCWSAVHWGSIPGQRTKILQAVQ